MEKLAVVALGGNALVRGNQSGTIEEQEQNSADTMENLVYLIQEGYQLILTHGNGPQVGNILMKNDAGEQVYHIPQMPLDVCVANSQGGAGYMIERILRNVLRKHGIDRKIVTIVTQVVVDMDDPGFKNPTKRVGRIYDKEQADELANQKNWIFKEEIKKKGGWRRVVPSPAPIKIINDDIINTLARQGIIVIASGGGGIPVYIDETGGARPTEAVIDKDLASSLLASRIKADEFYILTDVPYVYVNYNQPDQKALTILDKKDTEKHIQSGMFAEGSMEPKVKASLNFIENGGGVSVITEATKLEDKNYGTRIVMAYD